MRVPAMAVALAMAMMPTMENAQAGEEAAVSAYEQFTAVRELDRRCRMLAYFERADISYHLNEAAKSLPEYEAYVKDIGSKTARDEWDAALDTYQAAASQRVRELPCDGEQTTVMINNFRAYIGESFLTIAYAQPIAQKFAEITDQEPVTQGFVQQIFAYWKSAFGENFEAMVQRIGVKVQNSGIQNDQGLILNQANRLRKLGRAALLQTAAQEQDARIVYAREDNSYYFDVVGQNEVPQGLRASQQLIKIWTGQTSSGSYPGFVSVSESGDVRLLIHDHDDTLSADGLRAQLLWATDGSASDYYDNEWRSLTTATEGVISQEDCVLSLCVDFPDDAGARLKAAHDQGKSIYVEVYIGTAEAFPVAASTSAVDRMDIMAFHFD